MSHRRFVAAAATWIALAAAALPAAAQDKIIWKDNRAPTEGSVVSVTFKEIKYRLPGSGGEQEDLAKDVKDIEFDPENTVIPYEYNQGKIAFHKGSYKEAVEQFERAINRIKQTNSPNHPIRDFCRRYIIEAHMAAGDAAAVVTSARELRKEKPDSFFLRTSFLLQYGAAKMRRDMNLQEATIKEIEEVVRADRKYQDLQRDANLLRADLAEASKKPDAALAAYTSLSGDKDVWEEVSLGTLRCLSALGRTNDLRTKVESLLLEVKDRRDAHPRVYLGALVGRGDVNLADGKIKEALLDYMKAALDPGLAANSYEHETSLAKAAIAAARFAKQFGEKDNKTSKALYLERSKELREDLKRAFPQTAWLGDVEAAIKDAERGQ